MGFEFPMREVAKVALNPKKIEVYRGACPECTAKVECEIKDEKFKISFCENCGQKIVWEAENEPLRGHGTDTPV